jgi:ferredoxin-type protein NapH
MDPVRKWVQTIITLLTNSYWLFPFTRNIYQGPLKVICFPGLNCYSCPASVTSCPIGSLQQLLAGVRISLEHGLYYLGFYVVGILGILGGTFGRLICGWACPFGLFQELLHTVPSKKYSIPHHLSYLKYGFLLFFVLLLPTLVVNQYGAGQLWFCKYVCPAGTVEAGLPLLAMQPDLRASIGILFYNKLAILFMFILWSIVASRPFCRTACPLGAFYALFNRAKLVRLRLLEENCTKCKACHGVCPMGVKFNESPDDAECITCLACMTKACEFNAISLEIAGISLTKVSRKRKRSNRVPKQVL